MKIENMSPQEWKKVQTEIHDNTATFFGRKILYIKPGEIEWFDNEVEATQKGFSPAQSAEIHKLAMNQLKGADLKNFDDEFSSLIDMRKAWNLLSDPNSSADSLHLHGMLLASKGKKFGIEAVLEMGQKCLEKAASKFVQAGNIAKANTCKKKLVENVGFNENHPLYDLSAVTDVRDSNNSIAKGRFVSHLNGGNLKHGAVKVSSRIVDQNEIVQLSFKISYPARKELETQLQFIKDNLEAFKATVSKSFAKDVILTEFEQELYLAYLEGDFRSDKAMDSGGLCTKIDFAGIGTFRIGASPDVACGYNRIEMEFPAGLKPGETLTAAQKMLKAIGVTVDLNECHSWDVERKKMMTIFHNYFPSQAFDFENQTETYSLLPNELKREISEIEPRMDEVFDFYEQNPHLISEQEVYPGKQSTALLDIPMRIREAGGIGLMIGVSHPTNVSERIAAMLKVGPMASQDRFESGLLVNGTSSGTDYSSGGGDSVFTRMITATGFEDSINVHTLSGRAQILIDVDILARGGYAFTDDTYGQKNRFDEHELYAKRLNLWELTAEINTKGYYDNNEFMVKNHIPPSYIRGIVVAKSYPYLRGEIIDELHNNGSIVSQGGVETINGKPLDEFIQVSDFFNEKMWEK